MNDKLGNFDDIVKKEYAGRIVKLSRRFFGKKNKTLRLSKNKRFDLYVALDGKEYYIYGINIKWIDDLNI